MLQTKDLMKAIINDQRLIPIANKVIPGIPVSKEDALVMLGTNDILGLGAIANFVRERINGNKTYYGVNMNLNYTNICEIRCPLCAFSCDKGDAKAYCYTIDEIEERVRKAAGFGIEEVHIVGGLNPDLGIDYFIEMLKRIKSINKNIFIVAFTAAEFDYFAKLNDMKLTDVFSKLKEAGLGAMPGGGAEIFSEDKRSIIAPRKISGKRWLDVMKAAHSFGIKTNATILYNHIEDTADIADHFNRIRELQNETGGFKTFVPLPFHSENTEIVAKRTESTGFDDIRLYATARIFLHNIPHIKGLWMYLGEKMAQVMLSFGVDDIGSTYHYEKVVHSAGAKTPDYGSEEFLRNLIISAGRKPVKTTAGYVFSDNI